MTFIEALDNRIQFAAITPLDNSTLTDAQLTALFKNTQPKLSGNKLLTVTGTKGHDEIHLNPISGPVALVSSQNTYDWQLIGVVGRDGKILRHVLDHSAPKQALTDALAAGDFMRVTSKHLRIAWYIPAEMVTKIRVDGGAGDDIISCTGPTFPKALFLGGRGDDTISAGPGATVGGGEGNDKISFSGDSRRISVADGGADDDLIIGSAGDESLYGGAGDDTIITSYGRDTVRGGAGNDTIGSARGLFPGITSDTEADDIDGGAGIDRAWSREFNVDTVLKGFEKYTRSSETTLWDSLNNPG